MTTSTGSKPSYRTVGRSFRASRGFTLIELMVAMVAALMVTMAAYMLSKGASRFFQNEARISTAQLSVSMGMNRLVSDLQRASFMSSPNIAPGASGLAKDPAVCLQGALPNVANGINRMAGVTIFQGQNSLPVSNMNGFNPDRLQIVGTFGTTEQFPVQAIVPGANGGVVVYLQPNSAAVARSRTNGDAQAAAGGAGTDPLSLLFRQGRALRLVDQSGNHEYGIISTYTNVGNTSLQVALLAAPGIAQKTPGTTCGYSGFCVGCLVNPVARVQYDIESLVGVNDVYTDLINAGRDPVRDKVTGDDLRTELVRQEFAFDTGAVIAGTREIAAEYAVDLKFGIETVGAVGGVAPGTNPGLGTTNGTALTRYPITFPDTAAVYTAANDPVIAGSMPERIRTVQVRLATRSRAPDRDTDAPFFASQPVPGTCDPAKTQTNSGCVGPDGRRTRFNVSNSATFGTRTRWARVRTQYADVALPNQMGIVW